MYVEVHNEAAVIQSRAKLSADELYFQFISDATEIVSSSRGEPWYDLLQLAETAFEDADTDTLERYTTIAETALLIEDYGFNWENGYTIFREV
jgi:hypothetical protein